MRSSRHDKGARGGFFHARSYVTGDEIFKANREGAADVFISLSRAMFYDCGPAASEISSRTLLLSPFGKKGAYRNRTRTCALSFSLFLRGRVLGPSESVNFAEEKKERMIQNHGSSFCGFLNPK